MADGAPARPVHMFGRVFGDPFDRRRFNAWNVFVRLAAAPDPAALPAFWLQAGDDDFPAILDGTVRFHQALRRAGTASELRIDDGGHAWPTWARDIVPALRWLGTRRPPFYSPAA